MVRGVVCLTGGLTTTQLPGCCSSKSEKKRTIVSNSSSVLCYRMKKNHVETKIYFLKNVIKIRCWSMNRPRRDPDFHHKLAVFVMVQSCRLLPPTLSVQDVPGRADCGGTSSTKPELLAPLVKTKLRLLFPSSDSPLARLPGASFGFFQQHMLTRNWPPVPHTKAREASLAAIQRRHRSQSGLKDKRRHSMDSLWCH